MLHSNRLAVVKMPWTLNIASRVKSMWFDQSLRRQLTIAVALMLAFATAVAGVVAVINGRKAVDTEMRSSIAFAEKYLRATVQRISADSRPEATDRILQQVIGPLRHAQLYIQKENSEPELIKPIARLDDDDDEDAKAPEWFTAIMKPDDTEVLRRYIYINQTRSSLLIAGHAQDEINEKWHELSSLAMLWFIVVAVLLTGLNAIMGRILDPVVELSRGLVALEAGQRDRRVTVPGVRELADISRTFNSLAASLDNTRNENGALYRQMMDVQENERRQIASELHDEAGPCLFGITANTESVVRLTDELPAKDADQIRLRTTEILAITERLKSMNRGLLRRLRPVSIGKVSITNLITELIRDFERRYSDVTFVSFVEVLSKSYGEAIDLTVYRCVQEALTNAVRHGAATSCIINLDIRDISSTAQNSAHQQQIALTIRDNGVGVAKGAEIGFGLVAMRERVLSVGGTWLIGENWPAGTMVTVTIPVPRVTPKQQSFVQTERSA